jgi:putative peptidoglycan lipid II flippase
MVTPNPSASPEVILTDFEEDAGSRGGQIGSGFRVVSIFTFASRILGLARDMVMAAMFGAGPLMDAFSVAFRIPNLARRLFGEGALTAAFLPIFVREHEREGAHAANDLVTAAALCLGGALFALVLLIELGLAVIGLLVPMSDDWRLLVLLTAVMLPYALLICVTALLNAVLHSLHRFAWPAFVPIILNVLWMAAIAIAAVLSDDPRARIQWVAWSVVFSGVVQLAFSGVAVRRAGVQFSNRWRRARPLVNEVVQTMLPVILVMSITQLNSLFDSLLAWGLSAPPGGAPSALPLESGTASALYFAQRMYQFPLGVFGVALGTVLFPLLSRHTERGELAQVGRDLTLGMRLTLAIGLPASLGLILLREPIAVAFFERGAFTSEDSALTARCIAAYGVGVWSNVGLHIIHRGFFALGERRIPTRIGLTAVGVNLTLNLLLIWPLAGAGLALSTALASIFQFVLTVAAYQRLTGLLDLPSIGRAATKSLLVTAAMGIACLAAMGWLPMGGTLLERVLSLIGPIGVSAGVYLGVAKLIGLEEPFVLLLKKSRPPA